MQVDPANIQHMLDLASKGGLNVEGLSGSLDLSDKTGAAKYSVEISCPGEDKFKPGASANFVPSSFYYDQGASTTLGKVWEADNKTPAKDAAGKQICPLLK